MEKGRVWNFAAGPSVLPEAVLKRAQAEMLDWNGTGMSVMEMSHRSPAFRSIFDHAQETFRKLMNIPDSHRILFLQGGACLQFSMVPCNLMENKKADYAVTGHFSASAAKEAAKYGDVHIACSTEAGGHTRIPAQEELSLRKDASYFHYCANNTIYGTEWQYVPDTGAVPLVCDMSSSLASRCVDVSRYGLIYAGAQKNMAPAGLTVVIIREDLAGKERADTPLMLSYRRMIDSDSMFNTPPCWNIYLFSLVMDWIAECGGIGEMERRRNRRSAILYDLIDRSSLFRGHAEKSARSGMNVTFSTGDRELDSLFVREAAQAGLVNLKGHRLAGGMRASIYNAMEEEGVKQLALFMEDFERRHG